MPLHRRIGSGHYGSALTTLPYASIDWVGQKLADCVSIAESALDTLVQRRPPTDLDLPEATRKTPGVVALPFGIANAAATFQDALRGKFADQVGDIHPLADQIIDKLADQPPPTVNMLHVGRCPKASLQTILEENLDSESHGSMEIVAETTTELLPLPPFRGSAFFSVSIDSPPQNGKTEEERAAHENQNVNHVQR